MAFTKLEKDMNIIQKLDDEPNDVGGMTSAELKAKFDEGNNAMKEWINNTFIPEAERELNNARLESLPKHAHLHSASGADPITPDMIGAASVWGTRILAGADLNDYMTDGLYHFYAVDSSSIANAPVAKAAMMIVRRMDKETSTVKRVVQLLFTFNNLTVHEFYYRVGGISTGFSEWLELATTDYAVNKAGDTMTGALIVSDNPNGHQAAIFNLGEYTLIRSLTPDTSKWSQLLINSNFDAGLANSLILQRSDSSWFSILHTGNKPSGSYTGNGSATSRTIETGGIGSVCLIYNAYGIVIVTPNGAQYFGLTAQAYGPISVYFANGTLYMASGHDYVNGSGVTYNYQVL